MSLHFSTLPRFRPLGTERPQEPVLGPGHRAPGLHASWEADSCRPGDTRPRREGGPWLRAGHSHLAVCQERGGQRDTGPADGRGGAACQRAVLRAAGRSLILRRLDGFKNKNENFSVCSLKIRPRAPKSVRGRGPGGSGRLGRGRGLLSEPMSSDQAAEARSGLRAVGPGAEAKCGTPVTKR